MTARPPHPPSDPLSRARALGLELVDVIEYRLELGSDRGNRGIGCRPILPFRRSLEFGAKAGKPMRARRGGSALCAVRGLDQACRIADLGQAAQIGRHWLFGALVDFKY